MFEKTVVLFTLEPANALSSEMASLHTDEVMEKYEDSANPPDMLGWIDGCGVRDRLLGFFGDHPSGARYVALVVEDAQGRQSHRGELYREVDSAGQMQYRGFLSAGPYLSAGMTVQYIEFELKATRQTRDCEPSAIVGNAYRIDEIGCEVNDETDGEHWPMQLFF